MSQELLYTSTPKGLKPGARGFCTVVATDGMPAQLQDRLESLSGYRHAFMPGTPNAGKNPVVYSHVRVPDRSRNLHILSRIADFGLDYSQRTNKLAHHVVLEPNERAAGGPAWLLAQPSVMQADWDQQVVLRRAGRPIPAGDPPVGPARRWKELTGDAGWGGVLAESIYNDPSRFVFLIFQAGQELLPLFAESIALLSPSRRWDATFITYLTGLPQDVRCAWRGVLQGSPEEAAARRFPNALVLDLTKPLGEPTASRFVEAARAGTIIADASREPPPSLPPALGDSKAKAAESASRDDQYYELADDEPTPTRRRRGGVPTPASPPARLGEPPAIELPPSLPPALAPPPRESAPAGFTITLSKEVLGLAALAILALFGIAWRLIGDGREEPPAPSVTHSQPEHEADVSPSHDSPERPVPGETHPPQGSPPRQDDVAMVIPSPTSPTGEPPTEPEQFSFSHVMRVEESSTIPPENFVACYKKVHPGDDPGSLDGIIPPKNLPGGSLFKEVTLDAAQQPVIKPDESLLETPTDSQPLIFEVTFNRAGKVRFTVNVIVKRTRFDLQVDGGSLSAQKPPVKVEELTAKHTTFSSEPVQKIEWKDGKLRCQFALDTTIPDNPFTVDCRFATKTEKVHAQFEATLHPAQATLTTVNRKPLAPRPSSDGPLPLAKVLREGKCELVLDKDFAAAKMSGDIATCYGFPEPLASAHLSLFQPADTLNAQSDLADNSLRIVAPSDLVDAEQGRFRIEANGGRLVFVPANPNRKLEQLTTLLESVIRVSGSSEYLIALTPVTDHPQAVTVTKNSDTKGKDTALKPGLIKRFGNLDAWKLLLQDPRSGEKGKWLTLVTGDLPGENIYHYRGGRKVPPNDIYLENVKFSLIPPGENATGAGPKVTMAVTYPEEWGHTASYDRLSGITNADAASNPDPNLVAAAKEQLEFLRIVYPPASKEGVKSPFPDFRVCALGYSRLYGPASAKSEKGERQSILVVRVVVGMSLKELEQLGREYLVTVEEAEGK